MRFSKKQKVMQNFDFGSTLGKVAGIHKNCGGEVIYYSTNTRGWRTCDKCKASSIRGDSVSLTTEA